MLPFYTEALTLQEDHFFPQQKDVSGVFCGLSEGFLFPPPKAFMSQNLAFTCEMLLQP